MAKGMFDNITKSPDGASLDPKVFGEQMKAFATLDMNYIFKSATLAVLQIIEGIKDIWNDLFNSNCNDQDRVLVERFVEQIPGMFRLLIELGYYDSSMLDFLNKRGILEVISSMGRPRGASPCNELIGPARNLFTILFGIRMTNSNFLDALDNDPESYYSAAGWHGTDIPREAVERAVFLKKNFFPNTTYNNKQWDLNKFQEYPLVAPIPDPFTPGQMYNGEFMGIKVVNGYAITDIIPDIPTFDNKGNVIDTGAVNSNNNDNGNNDESFLDKIRAFIKEHPVEAMMLGIGGGFLIFYAVDENKK